MKEYTNETPVFSDTLPITETTDVAHPDTINPGPIQAFENTLCNRADIEQLKEQEREILESLESGALVGPKGSMIYSGTSAPSSSLGLDGDVYFQYS